jgi:dienelactone hydrolase
MYEIMTSLRWVLVLWLVPSFALCEKPTLPTLDVGSRFRAADTLACGTEANDDARECLANLSWIPTEFTVHLEAAEPGCGAWCVRFPSARPVGNSTNDLVAMEWFAARDREGNICKAPAIVVVHESGRRMTVGRLIARGLSTEGLHAFLLHLPGYGARRVAERPPIEKMLPALQQAISDVRRARDAVVALPAVDRSVVGLQGTSLGGFVTATVAGLDSGYDRVFILLAGGNLHEVVLRGAKDAAKTRSKLAQAGVTEQQIIDLARRIEPLRLAHRINPAETWLYSGKFDDVVPPSCSLALAKAARLPEGHHIEFPADHYSGIIYLPQVVDEIYDRMTEDSERHDAEEPVQIGR